jgi:iron-sulfur cluster assembly accessory protein
MEQHIHLNDAPPTIDGDFRLELTDVAVDMAAKMMQRQGLQDGGLRVSVSGGGCSGFQYNLGFDQQKPDDIVLEHGGVRVFVDPTSASYLNGVTIDYVQALHSAGFKFVNPNANRTCGCGSSFGV